MLHAMNRRDILIGSIAAGTALALPARLPAQVRAWWRDADARVTGADALTAAWQERMGETRILHLVPTEEDYDYQEDVVDNGADE